MAANRRSLGHRLQAGDPLDPPALDRHTPGVDTLGKAWQLLTSCRLTQRWDVERWDTNSLLPVAFFALASAQLCNRPDFMISLFTV